MENKSTHQEWKSIKKEYKIQYTPKEKERKKEKPQANKQMKKKKEKEVSQPTKEQRM